MEAACATSGARSISDFARGAVLSAISAAGHHIDVLYDSKSEPLSRLDHVVEVVGDLELRVEHLLQLFDRVRVTAETSPKLTDPTSAVIDPF